MGRKRAVLNPPPDGGVPAAPAPYRMGNHGQTWAFQQCDSLDSDPRPTAGLCFWPPTTSRGKDHAGCMQQPSSELGKPDGTRLSSAERLGPALRLSCPPLSHTCVYSEVVCQVDPTSRVQQWKQVQGRPRVVSVPLIGAPEIGFRRGHERITQPKEGPV